MITHYLKLALRHLLKNRYYTLINVFGLVFGMGSALIIAKFIGSSLQMDSFHEQREHVYSITQSETIRGNPQKDSQVSYWGVSELVHQYPEVLASTRYSFKVGSLVIANDKQQRFSFFENRIYNVDSSFLDIFTFPLIYGDKETALYKANSIVLTRSASQRYFGDANPIGKTLTIRVPWGTETIYTITGVTENVPPHSRFQFDFLTTQPPRNPAEFWIVPDCTSYILLKEEANPHELSSKLTHDLITLTPFQSTQRKLAVSMDSLAKVQLSKTELLLIAVGTFIILISWLNYFNQIIAQSFWRTKEMGILRLMGATGFNMKTQFITESALLCLTSIILIIALYISLEPSLQYLTNGHLITLSKDPLGINILFLAIFALGIVLAATIPSLVFSSGEFAPTLRNTYSNTIGGLNLRKLLVGVQFAISTILIISVFVISDQLNYMTNKEKGIDMEDVLIVQTPIAKDTSWNVKRTTTELFKHRCSELPYILQSASSTSVPGEEYRWETYLSLHGNDNRSMVHQNGVDDQFFKLYNVRFLAGQNFIPDARWKNRNSIILNESAARDLGILDFEEIKNNKIVDHESDEVYDLIGVVQDYHQTSLRNEIRPIAFKFNDFRGHFSLKLSSDDKSIHDMAHQLSSIQKIWERSYPDASFENFFLDQKYAAQDSKDRSFGQLFKFFTILSICISCLGLFGLSLLISTKREKEIGVRKVFGASSLSILAELLKSYLRPLCLSMLIGTPIACYLMSLWLSNFAYRVELGWQAISFALISLTIIFLLTVGYHSFKSAMLNPVSILKD